MIMKMSVNRRGVATPIGALRLSPFDPLTYEGHNALGMAAIQEARYDDAGSHFAAAVQANPRFSTLYFLQAASLALAGRQDEAKAIARRLMELEPAFRIRIIYELGAVPAAADKIAEGARGLGLPANSPSCKQVVRTRLSQCGIGGAGSAAPSVADSSGQSAPFGPADRPG
jgi:tetratricopeptide (TPR) repeat protein